MKNMTYVVATAFVLCCLMTACTEQGVESSDVSATIDSVGADASKPDSTPPPADVGTPQELVEPEVAIDVGSGDCVPGEGCFGEPCSQADDCLSGICTLHLGDRICSETCDSACPKGWSCQLVTGAGSDGQYVCVSNFSHLCLPCDDSGDCSSDTPNACVRYPDGLSFCGGACDLETPCPSGYACQEVENTSGVTSYQCQSTAGVCLCSNLAIESGLSTPCETTNELGSCTGVRACLPEGLSDCNANTPADETCNGVDDDCDGSVDELTCDDGNGCTVDTCKGAEGCTHEALLEGECLDGDSCTIGDHCEEGICVGSPIECDDSNPCTVDSCDGLGGCAFEAVVAPCDDGEACTVGDLCDSGICVGGVAIDCEDGNDCTDDSCGEAGCNNLPNINVCDDGNACTNNTSCDKGSCLGEVIGCNDGNACTDDSCDPATGCVNAGNAAPCDDGDLCTLGDACSDGACASGANAMVCADGNACTDDACDGLLGCVFSPNSDACDDKNECTMLDTCVEGACLGAGSLKCDDGNPCTVDVCLINGGCDHEVVAGACDDGDACTINDSCVNGACESGPVPSCNDGNPCTDEACEGGDCVFTANALECDDGNACSSASSCSEGLCTATVSTNCNDGNICTDDGCNPATGCTTQDNGIPCTDGNSCTVGDTCVAGNCEAGLGALTCVDGNPCTNDSCEANLGCVFEANSDPCDDGDACTAASECADGQCVGTEDVVCAEGEICVDGECLCAGNSVSCDGVCVDLDSDVEHCGGCGLACAPGANMVASCTQKECSYECINGTVMCNEACVDTDSDAAHCGECNQDCSLMDNTTGTCSESQCACNLGFGDCDNDFNTGCEINTDTDAAHCGGCGQACPADKICVGATCKDKALSATCNDLLTSANMWGNPAKGVDLRAWTGSTLHYIGCNGDGCSAGSFNCTYNANAQTLEFGSDGTVRSMVDPGNAQGDTMATNYSGCCKANQVLGLCNGPDPDNNGININNAQALCSALGYQQGQLVSSVASNSCPEAHAANSNGTDWSTDFVSSQGYGNKWKCTGFK